MSRFPRLATTLLLVGTSLVAASPSAAGAEEMMPSMLVQTTPGFTVVLQVGPPVQTMTSGSSMMGASGSSAEVMVGGVGMPMASADTNMPIGGQHPMDMGMAHDASMGTGAMSETTDQGMVVNHHLEVHVTDNSTGAVVNDVSPVIRVRDKASGVSRDLNDVMAMYSAQMGPSDFHYGQNVWLPDGQYDITVMLGAQSALFRDVMISGGSMPMPTMSG